jgi:hypothetical protein
MKAVFSLLAGFILLGFLVLIAPSADDPKYFTNVADNTGLKAVPAHGVAFVDLNGDNYLDCVVRGSMSGIAGKELKIFLNKGDAKGRTFTEFTKESLLAPEKDGKAREAGALTFADIDNDGDMDAFSGMFCEPLNPKWTGDRDAQSAIFLNDGKGVFKILENSAVATPQATTTVATFLDYDNDGLMDLFVGNWYKQYGVTVESYMSRLYKGTGNGQFIDVTEKAGMKTKDDDPEARDGSRPVYGVSHCDYNNDGYQDILICAYGRQWNQLWKNNGDGTFTEVGEKTHFDGDEITHGEYPRGINRPTERPFRSNGNTFSVSCADYNRDGYIDLFLAEITHAWAGESSDRSSLLTNLGKEKDYVFKRESDAMSRTHKDRNWNQGDMHVDWIDFDNDGLQDLLLSSGDYPDGQYLRLFRQKDDHTFEDITDKCGFNWESSAGISVADFDRDGDLDILAGRSCMRMSKDRATPFVGLFRNDIGNKNNWITIQLRGKGEKGANKMGVGARITIEAEGTRQLREIYSGSGCGDFIPPEAHFGLAKVKKIDKITIQWPNKEKTTQTFTDVSPNRFIRINEGSKDIETIKLDKK